MIVPGTMASGRRSKSIGRVLAGLLAALSLGSLPAQDSGGDFTLTGARVLLPDGTLAADLAVVISGGQIRRVTDASEAELPGVKRLPPTSVLSPGLVDVVSSIGSYLRNVETARELDAEASARAGVDALHGSLRLALESGITAAMVCPSPENVLSGRAVTFSTAVPRGELTVLRDDGPLVFALGDDVLRRDRAPTSRGGARHLLREALTAARAGQGPAPLKSFVEGRIPAVVFVGGEPDLRAAFELFDEVGRVPHLVHSPNGPTGSLEAQAAEAAKRNALAIVGPFDFTSEESALRAPAVLDRAGVRVAFRGGLPVTSRLSPRVTAALAVRYGMAPAAARRALTTHAAEAAGVADRAGAITARKDADLVVFSEDPLRPDARVLEVYVRGVRHYAGAVKP